MNVINRTVFVIKYKTKDFREKVVCVIVSTFLIFMFADLLLFVDVLSYLCYHVKKKNNGGLTLSISKTMKNR